MMNQLSIFDFNNNKIRFVEGKPVANDIAKVLGYLDPKSAIKTLVSLHYKVMVDIPTIRYGENKPRIQKMMCLLEAGIYQLIFSSKLPEALKFQRWVFEEVLPMIRKKELYRIKEITPAEALLKSVELLVELERRQNELQKEQLKLAAEQEISKVIILNTETKVNILEAELNNIKNVIAQPIPSCNQTARQKLVELAQLMANLLMQKGKFNTFTEAIKEVWNRIALKVRNSEVRIDLLARKANNIKQFDKDYEAWEKTGKLKRQKPFKKNYPMTLPAIVESLKIEQQTLECAVSVANDLII